MARLSILLGILILCAIGTQGKSVHGNKNTNVNTNRFRPRTLNFTANPNKHLRGGSKTTNRDDDVADLVTPDDRENCKADDQMDATTPSSRSGPSATVEPTNDALGEFRSHHVKHVRKHSHLARQTEDLASKVIDAIDWEFGPEMKGNEMSEIADAVNSIFNENEPRKRSGSGGHKRRKLRRNSNANEPNTKTRDNDDPNPDRAIPFSNKNRAAGKHDDDDADNDADADADADDDANPDGPDYSMDDADADADSHKQAVPDDADADDDDDDDDDEDDENADPSDDNNTNLNSNTNSRGSLPKHADHKSTRHLKTAKKLKRANDDAATGQPKPGKGKGAQNVNTNSNSNVYRRSIPRDVNSNSTDETRGHKG